MRTAIAALAALCALLGGGGAAATVPGANGRIAFESDAEIYVMNADGSGVVAVTNPRTHLANEGPAWSPDGRRLAFGRSDGAVFVVNADASGLRQVTPSQSEHDPTWSPDGSRIAYESLRFGLKSEIFSIAVDGSAERRLTDDPADDRDPAWSPDGTRIAFSSSRDGNKEIYVMKADGSDPIRLTANAEVVSEPELQQVDENPQWSPDGRQIVFDSTRDGNFEIYSMNADGSNQRRLTDHPEVDGNPAFAPDGRRIVFDSGRDAGGHRDIFVMNVDGTGVTRLAKVGFQDIAPDWGVAVPDSRGCTIVGTIDEDTLVGTERADKICALAGKDTVRGLGGSDLILGEAGDDRLHGDDGRDQVFGGAGSDTAAGGADRDFLYGEAGDDRLTGGPGNDRLQGQQGLDSYAGDAGNDTVYARDGRGETVDGGTGRDRAQVDRTDRLRSVETRF